MPFSYEVRKDEGFVVIHANGQVGTSDGIKLIEALARDPAYRSVYPVLCDLRGCDAQLPELSQIEEVAGVLETLEHGHRGRIAVVAPPGDIFDLARLACEYTIQAGLDTQVFDAEDAARSWLSQSAVD